ncbi:MSHA biogenesis protein MshE [Methylohalomonas lacus]|uniref:MSHA biogenesis protein MshE n=1 Tax=Methylohalomonas lacus TaxID=398773 RepID=A0AAE3L2F6_9GAMM|nr:GspE/PulE family protein [Methylohalomonas lacus]MCS3904481.1 MSHA biogenesis protein MshE [Methylohalomonas lacus]
MSSRRKVRLGDLLVEQKLISEEQLQAALADQKKTGHKLGRALIENGFVDEEQILQTLSSQLSIPYIDILHYKLKPETVRLIPEIQARRFRAVALEDNADGVLVGMADPTNIFAYDELARLLKRPIHLAVVRERDLLRTLDSVYRRTEEISGYAEQLSDELAEGDVDLASMVSNADVADAPVVKLLSSLFEDAVQIGASDIHIEPDEEVLRIRQRVDGALQEQIVDEARIAQALVLRLKLIAGLDISEKRLPQDGRFSIRVKDRNIDVRMSTMPVAYGETVVMRLLDQSSGILSLPELGMPPDIRRRYELLAGRPHGMVLVTGPTGSGKTTTLYATLKLLNRTDNKIITVEDPVEYRLPRTNQIQVKTEIGLDFARVLRSALRHDPDIILVGEIRDEETAEIALRAAMTGHLVLSTLHTNDAISTINRLLDMGIKSYLLAAALHGILAQRLVRRVCKSCARPHTLTDHERIWLKAYADERALKAPYVKGNGCGYCNHTGYAGRIGVYELLDIDRNLTDILGSGDSAAFSHAARRAPGYVPLQQVALNYAKQGMTTMEEVLRVAVDIEAIMQYDGQDTQPDQHVLES